MDLKKLNSATKYPSILTYHELAERGLLTDECTRFPESAILTEKVDGTNGRIIILPDGDFFIGSREELLTARGDRVTPQKPPEWKAVVDTLLPIAQGLRVYGEGITTLYLEVYGGKVGKSHTQYSQKGTLGCRLFDMSGISPSVLDWAPEEIALWRDEKNGQDWVTEPELVKYADSCNLQLVPRLGTVKGSALPADLMGVYQWLKGALPGTNVALDDSAKGMAEGLVIRSMDRSIIRKARFQDYERTLKKRGLLDI